MSVLSKIFKGKKGEKEVSTPGNQLTKEQEEQLPLYYERFKKMALSTETDKAAAEATIRKAYEYMHRQNASSCVKDPEIIWAGGPAEGAKIVAQHLHGREDVTLEERRSAAGTASFGSFEAYWVSTFVYVEEQIEKKQDELAALSKEIVANCGTYWTLTDLVVMVPKPSQICVENDRLHNVNGPALVYPNGEEVFLFEGEVKGSLMEIAISQRLAKSGEAEGN